MKTLYFHVGHRDLIGGGQLALYNLAVALQNWFDVHLSTDFHPGMAEYEFLVPPLRPWKIGRPEKIDLFVASDYTTQIIPPTGVPSVFYCLFPRYMWEMSAWTKILTISKFSAIHIKARWNRDADIVVGGAFWPDYVPWRNKANLVMNVSRFFMEGDPETFKGHSKNQHLIIQAFKDVCPPGWQLHLVGSVLTNDDDRYLNSCRRLAGNDSRIHFHPMQSKEWTRDLYSQAKVFVHAMGYGRPDIAETEHYGICVEKALISGCAAIVHESGGAPEFGTRIFMTLDGLRAEMRNLTSNPIDHHAIGLANEGRTFSQFAYTVAGSFREFM